MPRPLHFSHTHTRDAHKRTDLHRFVTFVCQVVALLLGLVQAHPAQAARAQARPGPAGAVMLDARALARARKFPLLVTWLADAERRGVVKRTPSASKRRALAHVDRLFLMRLFSGSGFELHL